MKDRLKDKVIIVTGSGRGIGRAVAVRAAAEGAKVVVNSVSPQKTCEAVEKEIKDAGGQAVSILADVSKEEDVKKIVAKAVSEYGHLDIMIANAGIAWAKPVVDTTLKDWEHIFSINVRGIFLSDKYAVLQFLKQKTGGKIINAASIAAHDGFAGLSAYSATKFAVRGFTQALAKEVAKYNITVNAYCPGIVDTNMWDDIDIGMAPILGLEEGKRASFEMFAGTVPLGRAEKPEDTAALITFLASSDADYITGEAMIIAGGVSMV
ncbi:MAG: glucose 1-dehydrogenase [Synergistaceae bacterium]|nr:glucose 1-dehydrogenase [Synergistaceae bacterium]